MGLYGRHHWEEAILSGGRSEVGISGDIGGVISGNDDVDGEPDDVSGAAGRVSKRGGLGRG